MTVKIIHARFFGEETHLGKFERSFWTASQWPFSVQTLILLLNTSVVFLNSTYSFHFSKVSQAASLLPNGMKDIQRKVTGFWTAKLLYAFKILKKYALWFYEEVNEHMFLRISLLGMKYLRGHYCLDVKCPNKLIYFATWTSAGTADLRRCGTLVRQDLLEKAVFCWVSFKDYILPHILSTLCFLILWDFSK